MSNRTVEQKLKKKISKYEYISFDIFDTLVKRNIKSPADLFHFVQDKYNQTHTPHITDFCEKRITALKTAEKKISGPVTLDDIYQSLPYGSRTNAALQELEILCELDLCVPNLELRNLFLSCVKQNKHVVLISDMYLPGSVVKNILTKCGYTKYERLYVSCESGYDKITGQLYQIVLQDLNISSKKLLHIGDGWKNDILRAAQKGIATYYVDKRCTNNSYNNARSLFGQEKFCYNCIQSSISNHLPMFRDPFEKLGYEIGGPLIWGFNKWLSCQLKKDGVDRIFFLAREGFLLKKQFEKYHNNGHIETHYLYVSRKSLLTASLCEMPDWSDIVQAISLPYKIKCRDIIDRLGLKPEECQKELRESGLSEQLIVDGWRVSLDPRFLRLYNLLKTRIYTHSTEQKKFLLDYLAANHFKGRVAIIDIGWKGTMQRALNNLFQPEDVDIHGYYMGIRLPSFAENKNTVRGYIYEKNINKDYMYDILGFSGPLELFMTASHGTTLGYCKRNNRIDPVLDTNEYIIDGICRNELKAALKMQRGAEKFCKDINNSDCLKQLPIDGKTAFRNFWLFGTAPLAEHQRLFRSFKAFDMEVEHIFLGTEYKGLAGEKSWTAGFWNSLWKLAYLKDKLKIPFPYRKIYRLIRKRKGVL